VNEILKILLELDGYTNAKIKYDHSKPTMIPIRLIDTAKAERVAGFPRQGRAPRRPAPHARVYRKQR